MPMLRSLYTLEDQTEDEKIKEAIVGLRSDVEAGSSVAEAMERSPGDLRPALPLDGQGGGELGPPRARRSRWSPIQLEKLDALRRQISSAMMYPALVFGFAAIVMIIVVAFIVPIFAGIFEELASESPGESAELPLMTQITVGASDLITGSWYIVVPVLVGAHRSRSSSGRRPTRAATPGTPSSCKLPFKIGDVVQKVAIARWSRVFSGTISAGVPILQAVKIAGETAGNEVVAESDGGRLRLRPPRRHDRRPDRASPTSSRSMVSHMVSVGEETGQLEHMLAKIADFYEAEVDAKVKALTSLIEPIMIIFVGGVVGFIVISMYLPIFQLYDKIR